MKTLCSSSDLSARKTERPGFDRSRTYDLRHSRLDDIRAVLRRAKLSKLGFAKWNLVIDVAS